MSKAVLNLLVAVGTLNIISAQFVFEYDYDFHFPKGRFQYDYDFQLPQGRSDTNDRWSPPKDACIDLHKYKSVNNVPLDICKSICEEEEISKGCKSISYETSERTCQFSELGRYSSYYTQPCYHYLTHLYTELADIGIEVPDFVPSASRLYTVYDTTHFLHDQCEEITFVVNKTIGFCKKLCDSLLHCTAINYFFGLPTRPECSLKDCGTDPPYPIGEGSGFRSYAVITVHDHRNYTVYTNIFSDIQCKEISLHEGKTIRWCKKECDITPGCTAFNYLGGKCSLKACGSDPPYPTGQERGVQSYSIKKTAKNYTRYDGPKKNYFWAEAQGCVHIRPTWMNSSYVECEELCDSNDKCTGFNFGVEAFYCDLFYCTDTQSPPLGRREGVESWTKRYDRWSPPIDACIKSHTYKGVFNVPLHTCKSICEEEEISERCKSISYETSERTCRFSKLGTYSTAYTQPCYDGPNHLYTELVGKGRYPDNFVLLHYAKGYPFSDKNCRILGIYETKHGPMDFQSYCENRCRSLADCNAISWNERAEPGCALQTCRHIPPHPMLIGDNWKVYAQHEYNEIPSRFVQLRKGYAYKDTQCDEIGLYEDKSLLLCQRNCDEEIHCTAFNFNPKKGCVLRACGHNPQPPAGRWANWQGWTLEGRKHSDPPLLPPTEPRVYHLYVKHFLRKQCQPIISYEEKQFIPWCKDKCDVTHGCTAFNYFNKRCHLLDCGNDPPYPQGNELKKISYSVKEIQDGYTNYNKHDHYFYTTQQGCLQIKTLKNKSYTKCEEYCDDEFHCIGFNFNIKTFDCEIMHCETQSLIPTGRHADWEGWTKRNFTKSNPNSYIILPGAKDYYYHDRQCRVVGPHDKVNNFEYCKTLCDLYPECTAFNFNPHLASGCILRACGKNPPHPIETAHPHWQGYVLQKKDFRKYPGMILGEDICAGRKSIESENLEDCLLKCRTDSLCNALEYYKWISVCLLMTCPFPVPEPARENEEAVTYTFDKGCRDSGPRCHDVKKFCDTNSEIRDLCRDTCGLCEKARYSNYYGPYGNYWTAEQCKVLVKKDNATYVECEDECDRVPWCTGFNYYIYEQKCWLKFCYPENLIPNGAARNEPGLESWAKYKLYPEPPPRCENPYKCTVASIPADNSHKECTGQGIIGAIGCSCGRDPWCSFNCRKCNNAAPLKDRPFQDHPLLPWNTGRDDL